MKKRWIAVVLTMALACAPACAMEKAAPRFDREALSKYASFEENGTVWLARSNPGEAALARMGGEAVPYAGMACFGMELTGDSETGLIVPVLAFYYAGGAKLNAQYASVAVGGVRYDLALASETVQIGKNSVERMTAPLDETGLEMVRALAGGEEATILLRGDASFRMEPQRRETYANARDELSGRSAEALEDMLREFEQMGEYTLWDLNAAWWERMYGVEPKTQAVALPIEESAEEADIPLKAPLYLLSRGDQSNAVRALQELLINKGFLQGKADGGYGEGTVRAVCAAQTYMGMTATGSADRALIDALTGGHTPDAAEAIGEAQPEGQKLGETCEIAIARHWIADAVESTGGDRRTVSDADSTLIVYEGAVRNLSKDDLDFYWQLSATVKSGEYEYPCTLVCERNGGASLKTALPPMGEARLLIYAEVPETMAQSEWTLTVGADGEQLVIE